MPGGGSDGEEPMEERRESEEESDLEGSSQLGKLAAAIVGKKRKASSPIVKELGKEEELRKMKEMYEGTRREYENLKRQMERIQARMEDQLKDFKRAQEFFEDDGEKFQVVGKGKKRQGSKAGNVASESQGGKKDRKLQVEKLENGNVRVVAEKTTEAGEATQEESREEKKKPSRNPPIHVRERVHLNAVQAIVEATESEADIVLDRANGGFKILSRGSDSYRRLTGSLRESGIGAHWHQHREEKPLWTVIKGIPAEMGEEEVRGELSKLGLDIKRVVRMRKNKLEPYDMVVVTTERSEEGKKIFEVEKLGNFKVRVESKRKPANQLQCFRCQRFGHVAFRCTAKEACAFCAGPHASRDCGQERGRGLKARCANCGGEHPAFFRSCPRHPEQVRRQAEEDRERRANRARESGVRPGVSYAGVAGRQTGKNEGASSVDRARSDEWEGRIRDMLLKVLPEMLRSFNG